jgi:hypothetical protein
MNTRNPSPAATYAIATAVLLSLVVAACAGAGPTASPSRDVATPPPADQTAAPVPTMLPASERVPPRVMDAAVSDAATRAGVDPTEVVVLTAEAVTFPNGGLGCPEPGMMYTDVLTPGYRVVVEAGGREYDYRAGARGGEIRWCENPPAG